MFPVLGMRGEEALHLLTLTPGIEPVDSPRHASVLLVAGGVPPALFESLRLAESLTPEPVRWAEASTVAKGPVYVGAARQGSAQ